MKCIAMTNDGRFELRPPETEAEWNAYHSIRERTIWDDVAANEIGPYDPDYPDQHQPDYTPLVLLRNGIVIGTMGLQDMGEFDGKREVELRAVGIEPACQSQGYGRIMLMMAESMAHHAGYYRAGVWAYSPSVLFYARNGFTHRPADLPVRMECPFSDVIPMTKRLDLGIAQNDGSVLIKAA